MTCEECEQMLARAGVTVSKEGAQVEHVELHLSCSNEPLRCHTMLVKSQVTGVDSVHSPR